MSHPVSGHPLAGCSPSAPNPLEMGRRDKHLREFLNPTGDSQLPPPWAHLCHTVQPLQTPGPNLHAHRPACYSQAHTLEHTCPRTGWVCGGARTPTTPASETRMHMCTYLHLSAHRCGQVCILIYTDIPTCPDMQTFIHTHTHNPKNQSTALQGPHPLCV